MKKIATLSMLLLATISLNGMSRLGQSLPALRAMRSQLGKQPLRLPSPNTYPAGLRPIQQRGLFTAPRTGTYGSGQQACFNRGAFLLGGAAAAALAGKAAYDYFDTPEGRVLKQAYAAEELSREKILAQHGEEALREAQEVAPIQLALDLYEKAQKNSTLSKEDKAQLLQALPSILDFEPLESYVHIFYDGKYSRIGDLPMSIKYGSGRDFVIGILKNINLFDSRYHEYSVKNAAEKQFINSILDTTIGILSNPSNSTSTTNADVLLYQLFSLFPTTRLAILDKTIAAYDIKGNDTGNLLYKFAKNFDYWYDAVEQKYPTNRKFEELIFSTIPLAILKHLAQQEKGAGQLFSYVLSHERTWYEVALSLRPNQSELLNKQLIQHPELTPGLAAAYNNPAPEFDSFRDFVNKPRFIWDSEGAAIVAIKREAARQAKAGTTSGRVQE